MNAYKKYLDIKHIRLSVYSFTYRINHMYNQICFLIQLEELLKREIEEYWPLREMNVPENEIPYVNVLLLGPVGSGKSSFFNTLNSIFRNRVSIQARAGSSENSLTKSVSCSDIQKVLASSSLYF